MKRAIVVGSGAGGATVAKELQGRFAVTILEAGREFHPFSVGMPALERLRRTVLFLDEGLIHLLFPAMQIRKTPDRMVLVNGLGVGGTTPLSAGNALRQDQDLRALGIDLDAEFDEVYREIPVTSHHQRLWREPTRRLFAICSELGLDPQPTPKLGDYERCTGCGRCVLGCARRVKWDSRRFLEQALSRGATLQTGCEVERVVVKEGRAVGVEARTGWGRRYLPADLVVLAAGGLGTPVILQNSGFPCEGALFVDPVLCVAAEWQGCRQSCEPSMPFVVQRDHYILAPYFDYLSFFFNRAWRYPSQDIYGVMIKLADEGNGGVTRGKVTETLTPLDHQRLAGAVELCRELLVRAGAKAEGLFLGTLNAGHPGGLLPLTEREAASLHHTSLPGNLYVADATLLPHSLGNPPILTIIALAKRVSRICAQA
ncbi:MAG: GMC family oxidoreductase N-terminal domain-containing protein [Betaproteobacteria bacterium]